MRRSQGGRRTSAWTLGLCLPGMALGGCAMLPRAVLTAIPPCAAKVDRSALPGWARTGFHPPDAAMPHVLGAHGEIVAILFGDPLSAPPASDHSNKILWVSREVGGAGDLVIEAQRMEGTVTAGAPAERRVQGGPGPSAIDLPEAGCWRLSLAWGRLSDTLDLVYAGPVGGSSPMVR